MMKIGRILLVIFFILITGVVFYFGWVQIHLDENTYGIAFTKSNGYLNKLYTPGTFSWSFRKLIPGNFKLLKIVLKPQVLSIQNSGTLPSGKAYGALMPGNPDFTYSITCRLTYMIDSKSLPGLIIDKKLSPESIEKFYTGTNDLLSSFITDSIKEAFKTTNVLDTEFSKVLEKKIASAFDYIKVLGFSPLSVSFPDYKLYLEAKKNYFDSLAARKEIEKSAREVTARKEVEETSKMELLKKYGELLKQYPELVQLLAESPVLRTKVLPQISITSSGAATSGAKNGGPDNE